MDFRISSFCDAGTCVAVADNGYVRDNADPDGVVLKFSNDTWTKFIKGIK